MKKQWYAVKNISNLVHKHWVYDRNVKFEIVEEKDNNRYALLHLTKFKVLKWRLYLRRLNKQFKANLKLVKVDC